MARLSKDELNKLKEKYKVDRIWSYSRLNTYVNMPWEYYIQYILKKRVDTSNAWNWFGTYAHDIIQDYIDGKYNRSKMSSLFEDALLDWQMNHSDLQFPNDKIRDSYIKNMKLYFEDVDYSDILELKKVIELPIQAVFKDNDGDNIVFIGYADLVYREGDQFYIVDFKTSSKGKFTGKSLEDSAQQLKLYAIGIHQMFGVDYSNITLRFDMQKYVSVSFQHDNGNWSKPTLQERKEWLSKQVNRINKILDKNGIDLFTATDMINEALSDNNLSSLPDYVQERFKLDKGFIDVEMNSQKAQETEDEIVGLVSEILTKEQSDNLEEEFPEPRLEDESFYLYNLAPGLLEYHKEYLNRQELKDSFVSAQNSDLSDLFQ